MTDEQIMMEVSRGELPKASILFERYHARIFGFFIKNCHSYAQSQDLTQMVFERMLKYKKSFQYGKSFQSWIFQIARNIRNDHYTKIQRAGFELGIEDVNEPWEMPAEPEDDQEAQLHRALRKLDPDQREVLVLSKFQKMKYEEIATILDCSVGAVKVKVHRAIKKLRNLYFMVEAG